MAPADHMAASCVMLSTAAAAAAPLLPDCRCCRCCYCCRPQPRPPSVHGPHRRHHHPVSILFLSMLLFPAPVALLLCPAPAPAIEPQDTTPPCAPPPPTPPYRLTAVVVPSAAVFWMERRTRHTFITSRFPHLLAGQPSGLRHQPGGHPYQQQQQEGPHSLDDLSSLKSSSVYSSRHNSNGGSSMRSEG